MLNKILKGLRRGIEGVKTAPGKAYDNYRLNKASDLTKSAVNKTGGYFASANTKLGDPRSRGYDNRVKQQQKNLLKQSGKTMQEVSENNRKRLERLENIK
jgi:hypothetical protein